jgi:phosphomannomutase
VSHLHDKTLGILQKKLRQKFGKIITIDGIKVIVDDDTWALVRKSNTEDIIRISVESNDLKKAQQIQKEITILVKQSHGKTR